jgi:hypothetical protein
MKPVYARISLAGMTSFLLVVASLLGFSSVMPKAATSIPSTTTNPRVDLEDQPFAVGHYRSTPTNITETEVQFTFEGNTTITLPNSTETITTSDTGQGNVTFLPGGGGSAIRGQIHMITQDGSENATGDFTEFMRTDESTGIGIAYFFSTNSTASGMLAPFNNKIAVFLDEVQSNEYSIVRFFEWKSGEERGALRDIDNGASTSTTNGSGGNDTNTVAAVAPATAVEIPTFIIP